VSGSGLFDAGIGLRQPHYREIFERLPPLGFVEVHSENFFLDGGAAMHALERARAAYPLSLHGVGLSLGSADAISEQHLAKLQRLVERMEPTLVSEHLCWGGLDGWHANDLLPLPHTAETLALMTERVGRVQDALKRPILVENLSAYVQFRDSAMSETEFMAELARRSGCGLLLDLNNLHVNAVNFGFDALSCLADLPAGAVGEIHLAGHHVGQDCLVDTHDACVCPEVWALYEAACAHYGPKPTLVEWDARLPALDVLLGEAEIAREIAGRHSRVAHA
jgi:uncharacterized protein